MLLPYRFAASLVLGFTAISLTITPVQASTFTFNDQYYVSSLSEFHTLFGASTSGYSSAGIYQETNTSTPVVTRLGNGSTVPGEYVQNTTPNLNQELVLYGWGKSLNNGQQVANVDNLQNPINGVDLYFRYNMGGSATPFLFNGFDLKGSSPSANLDFTLEGLDASNHILDSTVLTVAGNTFTTETLNWSGITTVEIVSTISLPVNWGSGTLYMDNVEINDSLAEAPEPSSLALLGLGLIALGFACQDRIRQSMIVAKNKRI